MNGLQAVAASQNGHFHAGSRRQIVDQAVVAHVAVEGVQLAVAEEGVENAGGVLVAALEVGRFVEKFFQIGASSLLSRFSRTSMVKLVRPVFQLVPR